MTALDEKSVALVLAAHGDRGGEGGNSKLAEHAAKISQSNVFADVYWGVLNGGPTLEDALDRADACGAKQIVVYPVFMSAGYFVKTVLTDRVAAAGLRTPTGIMQPLGLDKRLALLMLEHALRVSKSANVDPGTARLLIVGHGSKNGSESADATKRAARLLSPHSPYVRIETAFIDEAPFIADALERYDGTSVVAGFLSGEGLHGGEDIPDAIKASGARALYTGPIGLHPRVPELIVSSLRQALAEPDENAAQAAPPPRPEPEVRSASPSNVSASPAVERPQIGRKPRTRSRGRPLRLLLKSAAALVLIAALAIGAVAFLVPEDAVRDQVVSMVKQQTGRDLAVRGKTSFALFPNIGVEMENVTVSNPPGMAQGEMLRMDSLNLNLKLLPLLWRKIEIDRFILVRPEFNLVVDAEGRKNWEFRKTALLAPPGAAASVTRVDKPVRPMMQAQAGLGGGAVVQDISLGTVRITGGTLNYADQRAGTKQRVEKVNVTLVQPQVSEPLDAEGDLVWRGEKVSFVGRVTKVSALLHDEATKAKFKVATRHGKSSFDGRFTLGPAISANGAVKVDTSSLRSLAGWLGDPLPSGGGLGPFSISGNLGVAGETVTFSKARIGLDGMSGDGEVSVRLKGVRPHITASLSLDKLDLNPYVEGASTPATGTPAQTPAEPVAEPARPAPKPGAGESLTDFINKLNDKEGENPAPQVRAWSEHAINVAGLRTADAKFKLTANAIYFRKIKTGPSDLNATLQSGVLTADLTRLTLYSGTGTGRVSVNGARAAPGISAQFNLSNIAALPLLKDAIGFDWISGRANMTLSVAGNGRSQSEIMRSLLGQGQFAFANGAIEGLNIPAMARGLKQGQFDGWKRNEREKTDFSQLAASFVIQNGVATNKDLNLVGPFIRMTGEGTIDLGNERLDYSALPRVVASLEGQGAQLDPTKGLAVPVKVTGPWARPKIVPDLERLLRDPELAQDAANKVGTVIKKLKNKEDVNNLLQGILGGGNQQPAPGGTQPQGQGEQVKPEDVLKKLFR